MNPSNGQNQREQRRLGAARRGLWLVLSASVVGGSWSGAGIPGAFLGWGSVDVQKLPAPASRTISFDQDVRPIFEQSCLRCHGPERPKSGLRLDQREAALKGGSQGVSIVPGKSAESPLIHYVARLVEDMEMPPVGKGEALTPEQVSVLRAWIDQGASWGETVVGPKSVYSLTPTLQWISVDGNEGRFREHWWTREGWGGGAQRFEWTEQLDDRTRLMMEGHALAGVEDYLFKMSLDRRDVGFVRAGFRQFRRYFDDTGGAYAPLDAVGLTLDRDLYTDWGKAWIELGVNLPRWPQLVVGYEYHYKDGERPTLQWGWVTDGSGSGKSVYPAFKALDERVHVVRMDAAHEFAGLRVEDQFRVEFSDLQTTRQNVDVITQGSAVPDVLTLHRDNYRQFLAANALRLEKPLKDWWLLSGGYLYSHMDGDVGFSQETFTPSSPGFSPFVGERADQILLEQRSHYFNLNTMLGPWKGWHVSAGAQSEWTRQHGFRSGLAVGDAPSITSANLDKSGFEEELSLRYTGLPYSVVFASARFRQEYYDHYEEGQVDDGFGDGRDFLRDSDVRTLGQDYRAGFTVSPWKTVSLQASYRWRWRDNDYQHLTDQDAGIAPGNGYPAFILAREQISDEVEAKLVYHIRSWWKASLKYQLTSTDFESVTSDVVDLVDPSLVYVGGGLLAGNYDAHVYSVNMTLTPWKRVYLSSTLSLTQSRMRTGEGGYADIAPYEGDVTSVLNSVTYALTERTDVQVSYSFSHGDYAPELLTEALPLGIVYDRHGLLVGLNRRFNAHLSARVQYGFYDYNEPSSSHVGDYTAHGVFASLSLTLP